MQTVSSLIAEETWGPMEGAEGQRVLKSASSLFAALKKSLSQCSNNVSKGAPMLQLLSSFQVSSRALRLLLVVAAPMEGAADACCSCSRLSRKWWPNVVHTMLMPGTIAIHSYDPGCIQVRAVTWASCKLS